MKDIMGENQLTIVKKYEIIKPLIQKISSIFDNCFKDCHKKYFHTFEDKCEYVIKLTSITNNERKNLTISGKSIGSFEVVKKITIARERGFIFNQIKKLTLKIYSNLQSINICYYLKPRIPMCHRLSFRRISQNKELIENFCIDLNNPFSFACRKWCLDNQIL